LYQAYYSEPKDDRINAHKKYKKQDIPFVTQLFTPDWIVHYMVENSLGRLWMESHHSSDLKGKWDFYLDSTVNNVIKNGEEKPTNADIRPESLLVLDPCQGSGHILVYVFDVLVQIYEAYGFSAREAASSIIRNNIWGLDIDERATQLAYFSVMMKARQYDRRFFSRGIQPHIYAIQESDHIDEYTLEYYCNGNLSLMKAMSSIIAELKDAKESGSLVKTTEQDWVALYARFDEISNDISMHRDLALQLLPLVRTAEALSKQYDIVITNPPYMGASLMPNGLKDFIGRQYGDYKSDIFAAFIVRCIEFCKDNGQLGLITPYVWMFLTAHEKLRVYINRKTNISSLIQLEYNAFEAACVPVATFTLQKRGNHSSGEYIKLSDFRGAENQAPKTLEAIANPQCGYRYSANQDSFAKIPGSPIAYWVSKQIINSFDEGISIDTISSFTGSQNITADNEKYLRVIWEVDATKLGPHKPWSFYIKGGQFRKWYGNIEMAVDWSDDAREFYRTNPTSNLLAEQYRFKEGITYTELTSSVNSFRYLPPIAVFDKKGPCIIDVKYNHYCLAFFNSIVGVQ
ncbi:MAG: BREX-1 system adenine-specific DNA-methyltransferase PglX, partial [Aeriscardovia sp.]|nr:BREX-1 system adenine-specific DNA-methyltransferase PglX [Aeriscardovia sp.]